MPYAADDFETIRARIEELNRDRVDRHVDRKILGKPTEPERSPTSTPWRAAAPACNGVPSRRG